MRAPFYNTNTPIKFTYVNWRGDEHEYVIKLESLEYGHYGEHGSTGSVGEMNWVLHGHVVTRDGDPRPDMGTRRRTFLLNKIQDPRDA